MQRWTHSFAVSILHLYLYCTQHDRDEPFVVFFFSDCNEPFAVDIFTDDMQFGVGAAAGTHRGKNWFAILKTLMKQNSYIAPTYAYMLYVHVY